MKKIMFVSVCLSVFFYSNTAFCGARGDLERASGGQIDRGSAGRVDWEQWRIDRAERARQWAEWQADQATERAKKREADNKALNDAYQAAESSRRAAEQSAAQAQSKGRELAQLRDSVIDLAKVDAANRRVQEARKNKAEQTARLDSLQRRTDSIRVQTAPGFRAVAQMNKEVLYKKIAHTASAEELRANLVSLHGEIEATKNQLLKLNQTIQSDTAQYNKWEKATNDAMWGSVKAGFDMLFDFADDRVKEHYEELVKVAREQHKSAAAFRQELLDLQGIRRTKGFVDGIILAGGEHDTWVEKLEAVRDTLGLISGELGEKPASKLLGESFAKYASFAAPYWKYGSAIADAAYANTLYYFDWQAVKQLDRNNESFKLAVEKLGKRMSTLVEKLKDTEAQLKKRNEQ